VDLISSISSYHMTDGFAASGMVRKPCVHFQHSTVNNNYGPSSGNEAFDLASSVDSRGPLSPMIHVAGWGYEKIDSGMRSWRVTEGLLFKKGVDQAISFVSAHNHLVRGDVKARRVAGEWRCPSFPQSAGKVVRIRSLERAPNKGPAAAARGLTPRGKALERLRLWQARTWSLETQSDFSVTALIRMSTWQRRLPFISSNSQGAAAWITQLFGMR
jgi:hypothetical protein